jgi:hypothetical protein
MYIGMIPSWPGTIIVRRIKAKNCFWPLNFNFAKAYPAKVQKKICETAIEIEMINEMAIAREIFAYWKMTSKVTGS